MADKESYAGIQRLTWETFIPLVQTSSEVESVSDHRKHGYDEYTYGGAFFDVGDGV